VYTKPLPDYSVSGENALCGECMPVTFHQKICTQHGAKVKPFEGWNMSKYSKA
jgi:hypothetical protein